VASVPSALKTTCADTREPAIANQPIEPSYGLRSHVQR
jgi:hypothetical protein